MNELEVVKAQDIDVTPMRMLQLAVQNGADLDRLQKLMDLQERWEKNEARKAFVVAMAEFKANPPQVYKDKANKQYDSWYTTIGNLVNTVNSALSQHGLSHRWDIDQTNGIKVTCILTHERGHSESSSMTGPIDNSGSKNPLQQIKSTVTYLKISTFEAVTGIASIEGNLDDDGTKSGKKTRITPAGGTWESLSTDMQTQVMDIVEGVRREFADKGPFAAATLWSDETNDLEVEAKAAGWDRIPSDERSAMKRARSDAKQKKQVDALMGNKTGARA